MFNIVKVRKMCEEQGISRQPMSYHLVFTGNPGTGKTTVARLIAEVYHSMGLLSKGHLIEVDRCELVAGYVGHTALKVQEVVEKAKGGVLFIDEAYSLNSKSENDFGHEAIEILLKEMEDNRDDLVVIMAGYPDLMNDLWESNPELSSRFSKNIYFPDYSAKELAQIFAKFCAEISIEFSVAVLNRVRRYFEVELKNNKKNFGNARAVRNYFEQTLINQANRIAQKENIDTSDLCRIEREVLPMKFCIENLK